MKLCGHTMGTPRMDLLQSLEFFSSIGCDAIEVRCAHDGQINPESFDENKVSRAFEKAQQLGISFACLTPYYKNFLDPKLREKELAGFRQIIRLAGRLRCPLVRAYGGVLPPPSISRSVAWEKTVSALRELANDANDFNVALAIETHVGTLTFTAAQAAEMVAAIGRPNVGILFDYAWIKIVGAESLAEAVRICAPWIRHVHVKDCVIERPTGKTRPCLMGEGEIEIKALLRELKAIGYEGHLSDEYEKYWQPALPDPEIGMGHNALFLKSALSLQSVVVV